MKYLIVLISLVAVINAEQSVYSDSDFIDPTDLAKKNSRAIFKLKQKINQLKERIEGLKSIIDSQENQIAILKQKTNNSNLEKIINQLSERIAKLEARPPQIIKVKEKSAPSNIITANSEPNEKNTTPKEEKVKKLSNSELYKESVLNFTKNRLSQAKKGFKTLLNKGYKKAAVSFYLGEIAFKQSRYKEAIDYYQKSATLDDSASYMDRLLLHTAIALKKKGKSKEAKIFFKAIIDGYPNSPSAKEAKKYLK